MEEGETEAVKILLLCKFENKKKSLMYIIRIVMLERKLYLNAALVFHFRQYPKTGLISKHISSKLIKTMISCHLFPTITRVGKRPGFRRVSFAAPRFRRVGFIPLHYWQPLGVRVSHPFYAGVMRNTWLLVCPSEYARSD